MYMTIQAALKVQLVKAVPDMFLSKLCDDILQYGNTTATALLQHLEMTYGDVTPDDLTHNITAMHHPWSPEQPLEDLFKQICICHTFVENHDPISKASAVHSVLKNLENSGVFIDAIKDWCKHPMD